MNRKARIGILSSMLVAALALGACANEPASDDDDDDDNAVACQSDADCKGDRICEDKACVSPEEPPDPDPGTGGSDPGTGGSEPGPAPEQAAELVVENHATLAIHYLYISPCSASTWGQSVLGSQTIPGGYFVTVTDIEPNCYDLRAESANHTYFWQTEDVYLSAGDSFTWKLWP